MIINKEYDVFIAFHGSSDQNGALKQAETIYNYLTDNGLKCFLFSKNSDSSVYKANFMKIMQSSLLLLVCNENIPRNDTGELNYISNYHLYVELDAFLALAQSESSMKSVNDAAVLFFTEGGKRTITPSPETLHPLFNNRDSFHIAVSENDEEAFDKVLEWAEERLDLAEDGGVSNEAIAILNGRILGHLDRRIEGVDLKKLVRQAKTIKCIGISNWTFSLTDGCTNLVKGIKRGTYFEMIFLDPEGECVKLRSIEEQKDTKQQILMSFDMIRSELSSKYKDLSTVRDHMKTYTYDQLPRENMIFIYTEADAFVIVQNYSFKSPGSKCPCFIFRKSGIAGESLFEYYENLYDIILNDEKTETIDLFEEREEVDAK